MSLPRQLAWILSLAAVATLVTALVHPRKPAWYRTLSPEELRWQIEPEKARALVAAGDVLVIDARSREKYEREHFGGAILLNEAEWGELMFEHMDRLHDAMDQIVIVYCDGTDCGKSRSVARQLRELIGLDPVYVLEGDWRTLRGEE